MNMSEKPKRPGADRVSGREMAETLAEVLQEQKTKAEDWEKPTSPGKKKTSSLTWVALLVLTGISAYVWFGNPSWLAFSPPPISPELADAGMRMEVFQHALLVEEFFVSRGRLPNDLVEAGGPSRAVEYQPIGDRDYRLVLFGPQGQVEYVSTDPLETFIGNAAQIIRQGGA
jgi:hypothetical protein